MKRFGISIACIGFVSTAYAADVQTIYTPAPPPPPPFNWTAFYLGGMGGYGFGQGHEQGFSGGTDLTGGFGGGQVGFNWQAPGSSLVGGVELDAAGSNIGRTETSTGFGITVTDQTKLLAFSTLRARLGWAPQGFPGNVLFYGTAGLAAGRNQISGSVLVPGFLSASVSDTQTHSGWTAGLGAEYAF